jgi:hypothetical protein
MFSFKKNENVDDEYRVLFDGSEIIGAIANKREYVELDKHFNVYCSERRFGETLIPLVEKDFSQIDSLKIDNWNQWGDFGVELAIYETSFDITGFFRLIHTSWNQPYNFDDYFIEFSRLSGLRQFAINLNERDSNKQIELDCSLDFPLLDDVYKIENLILEFHNHAVKSLISKNLKSVNTIFEFPHELEIPCEQYLLYFAQFLNDLGVNATSNIKHEAGKVLFSVTPTDSIDALDKIREALAVYLNLPSSPIIYDESFAAMRLQQQIENLQHSQKMRARELQLTEKLVIAQSEMIQEKNTIIAQKDSVIEQQNKVIEKITSKSIMMDSLENKEELEEIYDGLSIGESKFLKEQLGIHFNPAKMIKTGVDNLFGKGDEIISILDSDEETEKNS